MSKWTDEPGAYSVGVIFKGRKFGIWRQSGISGDGYASVQVFPLYDGSGRVAVQSCASLTPAQARQLARVLNDAADKAEAESAEGVAQ